MIDKIIKVARAEVGTTENPMNSNRTKYGKEYGWDGVPWCAIFVWWVFKNAGSPLSFKTASCDEIYRQALAEDRWVTKNFKPGDVVVFDFSGNKARNQHTGICIDVSGATLYTVEGNTSLSGSQDNGGCVAIKSRDLKYVKGAYRPIDEKAPTKKTDSPQVTFIKACEKAFGLKITGKYSDKLLKSTITLSQCANAHNSLIKPLQTYLNAIGYSCGKVDGIFGANTMKAVKTFQSKNGCVVDGEITKAQKTWRELLC